ncbi:hypothetical protein ACJJIG_18125 [Microbulbifer sp. SSSA007]|uniref:hypothetical protein n=1 Tax=Microbulbifer sp. SSSA007 TaxID=3243379 RepID=UPI004039E7A2
MRKIILFSLFLSMETLANGWSGIRDIEMIQQRECSSENKGFEITFKTDHKNPDSCSNPRIVNLSCTQPGYETMVSMALTAVATGKGIDTWVAGCDSEGHARVASMTLRP